MNTGRGGNREAQQKAAEERQRKWEIEQRERQRQEEQARQAKELEQQKALEAERPAGGTRTRQGAFIGKKAAW